LFRGRDRFTPVRTAPRWNEHDAVESDIVADGFGNEQMSVMNRVEAAAENADVNSVA